MENETVLFSANLALILPCYNPVKGWEKGIIRLYNHLLDETKKDVVIVIINDGSTTELDKNSLEDVKQNCSKIIYLENRKNRGKGRSLRRGAMAVEAKYYVYTDFDLPFLFDDITEVYRTLDEGFDIVTSRRGPEYWQELTVQRKLFSRICSGLNKHILKLRFPDSQAGLKGFNNIGKSLFLQTKIDRYLFDTEFILLAERHNTIKLTAIDVQLQNTTHFSNISFRKIFPEIYNYINLLWR